MVEILLHWKCSPYTYSSNINSFYHPTCQWDLENLSASAKHKDPPGITLIPTHSKQNSRLQTWECRLESAKHPSREESREDAHLEPKLRIGFPVIGKDGPIEVGIHPYALQVQQPAAWGHVYSNLLKMPQMHVRKLDRMVRSEKAYNQERASSTPTIQCMLKFQSHHFTFYCNTPCMCLFTYKELRVQSFKLEQPWLCCSSRPPQRKVDISHLG